MVRPISDLIAEADKIVEHHMTKQAASHEQEDVFKLAEELKKPVASPGDLSMTEKIAHAFALVDTVLNLPELVKIAQFEDAAREKGIPSEKVADYFEKNASVRFKSALSLLDE